MGIKATISSTTFTANHTVSAAAAGHNVPSLTHATLVRIDEVVRDLKTLVSTMQAGDPNIASINAQIAALS